MFCSLSSSVDYVPVEGEIIWYLEALFLGGLVWMRFSQAPQEGGWVRFYASGAASGLIAWGGLRLVVWELILSD